MFKFDFGEVLIIGSKTRKINQLKPSGVTLFEEKVAQSTF